MFRLSSIDTYAAIDKTMPRLSRGTLRALQNSTLSTAPLFTLNGLSYCAKLFRVYDCDSFYMTIQLHGRLTSFKCRLTGVDGPEIRSKCMIQKNLAIEARDCVRNLIDGKVCIVKCYDFDKYGRVLVDVELPSHVDLRSHIIQEHLGVPYDGRGDRTLTDWTSVKALRDELIRSRQHD